MPTLAAGASITIAVPDGCTLNVGGGTGAAIVSGKSQRLGALLSTLGPYAGGAAVTLVADAGSTLAYSTTKRLSTTRVEIGADDAGSPSPYVLSLTGTLVVRGTGALLRSDGAELLQVSASGARNGLARWGSALAAVKAGTRNAKLCVVSDSTGVGASANAGGLYANNNMASCWPYLLKPYFEARGFATTTGSVFGDSTNANSSATLAAHDPRRAFTGSWELSDLYLLGGQCPRSIAAGTSNKYSFAPAEPFDTIAVDYVVFGSYGRLAIAINGGAALTNLSIDGGPATSTFVDQASGSSGSWHTVTATVALGAHTINFSRAASDGGTGGIVLPIVRTWNSAMKSVEVLNVSVAGATTALAGASTNAWDSLNVLQNVLRPDLTLVCLDINDWALSVAAGTYDLSTAATHSEQLRKIVVAAQASGDVVLVTGAPSKTTSFSRAAQSAILHATRNVASICGVPIVDVHAEFGTQEYAAAAGLYLPNNDTVHPGAAGYAAIAGHVAALPGII